ncbi:MAG TPA: flagellar basal body rod C-terminal domain-containing protein, partial [Caulobacteraceae bacterium]|nr:flagellar basal body rod C-terminal domain-containing protein [Caulobacteraceae bacterium]
NSAGVIQQQVAIDFGAGTMTVGATSTAFTPSNFLATLNGLLSPNGSAAFTNGALSLSASGAGNGVAIADDPTTPATNAGQGFSQFFGLNNLVASSSFTRLATGLTGASPNTFSGTIDLQLSDAAGAPLRQVSVAMPTGGTVSGVLNALNTGVGAYGSFSLDADGRLAFTANNNGAATVSVMSDSTANSAGGPNISQMFGIGDSATAALATSYSVRADIAQNPSKLPFATLNPSASAGAAALLSGDGTGAFAMAQSGSRTTAFAAAGGLAAVSTTVSNYASQIAGLIGAKAANADNTQKVATATATQATSQLSSVTGVNLDQELVNLTTYQQAYSASARLVQAATTMYDSLLQMVP